MVDSKSSSQLSTGLCDYNTTGFDRSARLQAHTLLFFCFSKHESEVSKETMLAGNKDLIYLSVLSTADQYTCIVPMS
eukprot:SAG31_NODE_689_length_12806_cov_5.358857_5_plen_77_part_00